MPVLSSPDPSVGITCTLPALEMADRLDSLQDLVAHGLDEVNLHDRRLRIAIDRDGAADLYDQAVAWAQAKKACCSYLGFAVEKTPARIVLEIAAPQGGEPTLEAFQFVVLAAGNAVSHARSQATPRITDDSRASVPSKRS